MAVAGNVAAPIVFFLVLTATQVAMRVWGTSVGYRSGTRFLENLAPTQVDRIKQGAAVVGLAVTGALVATLLPVTTPLSYTSGGQTIALQKQLDSVLPALLPLTATLVVYILIRRRVSPLWVLLGTLVAGLLCGYFGILG